VIDPEDRFRPGGPSLSDAARRRRLLVDGSRLMAKIGRTFFRLPVGVPVDRRQLHTPICWASYHPGGACQQPAFTDIGLCEVHYREVVPKKEKAE